MKGVSFPGIPGGCVRRLWASLLPQNERKRFIVKGLIPAGVLFPDSITKASDIVATRTECSIGYISATPKPPKSHNLRCDVIPLGLWHLTPTAGLMANQMQLELWWGQTPLVVPSTATHQLVGCRPQESWPVVVVHRAAVDLAVRAMRLAGVWVPPTGGRRDPPSALSASRAVSEKPLWRKMRLHALMRGLPSAQLAALYRTAVFTLLRRIVADLRLHDAERWHTLSRIRAKIDGLLAYREREGFLSVGKDPFKEKGLLLVPPISTSSVETVEPSGG